LNGRYKNHYYPSTSYLPSENYDLEFEEYYDAINYLTIFDSYDDYEVDVYTDFYSTLDNSYICTVTDCEVTTIPLKCTDECLDYDSYYDTYFYLNTFSNNLISLFYAYEN